MEEKTTQLLEKLAQKLGTTTEYLWAVLLKQAPIDATVVLCQTLVVLLFGFILYKVHKRFMVEHDRDNFYDKHDGAAIIPMMIGVLIFAILIVACFTNIGDIVNGYLNPEYWALEKILNEK